MTNVEKILIQFLVTFIIVFVIYYLFILLKCKKEKDYVPIEVNIILMKHRIDIKKINLYKMSKIVTIATSLILAMAITFITNLFENMILSMFLGTIISVIVAFIVYEIIGKIYERRSKKEKKTKK